MVVRLPPSPASARTARQLATDVLSSLERLDLADEVAAVVSELVANAVFHAGTEIEVSIDRAGSGVRVAVSDGSASTPGLEQSLALRIPECHGVGERCRQRHGPVLRGAQVCRARVLQEEANSIVAGHPRDLFLTQRGGAADHVRQLFGGHIGAVSAPGQKRVFQPSVPSPQKRGEQYR